jgi:homoaconitate hydratase
MGSRDAQAYLASAEVVAASALSGTISGPGVFKVPADWSGVEHGFGTGLEKTTEGELGSIIQQLDFLIERVESTEGASGSATEIPRLSQGD